MTAFYTFVQEKENTTFPQQTAYLGCAVDAEKEECIGSKKGHAIALLYDGSQRINPVSEIGITAHYIYALKRGRVGILKYGAPPL